MLKKSMRIYLSISHPTSHPLIPASTAPSPSISIYPMSCVVCFVYFPEDRPRPWNFKLQNEKRVSFGFCPFSKSLCVSFGRHHQIRQSNG